MTVRFGLCFIALDPQTPNKPHQHPHESAVESKRVGENNKTCNKKQRDFDHPKLSNIFKMFVAALANGLALTPQMGWNTWNIFGCDINEAKIMSAARSLKNLGLIELGYKYLVIDDCWALKQRVNGRLQEDPVKFPSGFKKLVATLHNMGLLVGIYSSAGAMTCAGYPASLAHEAIDAQSFADWGFDYLPVKLFLPCNIRQLSIITAVPG
jgi:hypothetical protein